MTWSRGMSRMSLILILSYRLKEVTNSNVLHWLQIQRCCHISGTRFQIVMGFWSKCRILNWQVDYSENSKLSIADMWLISLYRVTYGEFALLSLVYYLTCSEFIMDVISTWKEWSPYIQGYSLLIQYRYSVSVCLYPGEDD